MLSCLLNKPGSSAYRLYNHEPGLRSEAGLTGAVL